MIYITLRAFTGSAATDETSLLLTGQAQGQGLKHNETCSKICSEICSGRMKSIRELSISRVARYEMSQLIIKNCIANINMKMKIKEEKKEKGEKKEKKEKPDLHQVVLIIEEAAVNTRPSSVSTATGATRPTSTPSQNFTKRRSEYTQRESVNLSKSVTFTCDHITVIDYQDCSSQECNDNSTHLNYGTTVDFKDCERRMAEANEYYLASNLSDITCTEVEKLRIRQLLRDHDMKDALEKERNVLEERRLRRKQRNVINMSSTLPIRNRPISRFDLYHHSNHQPNPTSRPISNPLPQFNTHPHSKPTPRPLSRPQSEPSPHLPSILHSSSLQSALLTPTPTLIRSRAGAELLRTRKPLLAPPNSSCSKSIPSLVQEHDITPRAVQSVDSGVDYDDSEYIASQDGNEHKSEDRDGDRNEDEDVDDDCCDREVDEKRMLKELEGREVGKKGRGEGGMNSSGECFWDEEAQEERKLEEAEEEREETVERNGSLFSIQFQLKTQSVSVMGIRYSLSKQSHLIFNMVVCTCPLVCMSCVCTMWHVLCAMIYVPCTMCFVLCAMWCVK